MWAKFKWRHCRYRDGLSEIHRGYGDFFLLQDLVTEDRSTVTFFMPFDDFNTSSVPKDRDTYREYKRLSIEFIEAETGGSTETLPVRVDVRV
jgi:hypothetical protein